MSVVYNTTEALFSPLPIDSASWVAGLAVVTEASSPFLWTLTAIVGASLLAWLRKPWTDENGHKIPKGPIGLPIFGNYTAHICQRPITKMIHRFLLLFD